METEDISTPKVGSGADSTNGAADAAAAKAEELKKLATERYKAADYAGAVTQYTLAIEASPSANLYTNRAAASLMLKNYAAAAADCK
jgi:hypothetical protein